MVSPPANVVRASLDLLVIVIEELPDALLKQHLLNLLTSLLQWLGDGQAAKLRAKSNKYLDLLLARFGYARISAMVPHRFTHLIKYLRKRADYMDTRKEKQKKLRREQCVEMRPRDQQLGKLRPTTCSRRSRRSWPATKTASSTQLCVDRLNVSSIVSYSWLSRRTE